MSKQDRDKILRYLNQNQNGADDDELTSELNLRRRQDANKCCRKLAEEGMIDRRRVGGKLRNFWKDSDVLHEQFDAELTLIQDKPWFWEGNVQTSVCQYLKIHHYLIIRSADTLSREPGKDIVAEKNGFPLWVTVKGYPEATLKTRPSTQAGHWFKEALFDLISWRGENENAEIALALPDYSRYRKLATKITWLQPIVRFSIFWVKEKGIIEAQDMPI